MAGCWVAAAAMGCGDDILVGNDADSFAGIGAGAGIAFVGLDIAGGAVLSCCCGRDVVAGALGLELVISGWDAGAAEAGGMD